MELPSLRLNGNIKAAIYSVAIYITLRPRHIGHCFADGIVKLIVSNENCFVFIKISWKLVPMGLINNAPAYLQIIDWCRIGYKPLSELIMVILLMHICIAWLL